LAIVEYPMGGVPTEEAVERAKRAFDQILTGLTDQSVGSAAGKASS
jgi:hypothetical protein